MFERRLAVEQSKPITMKTPFIFQKVIWLACWTSAGLAVPGYAVDWIPGVGANWSDSSRWVGGIVPNGFTGFAEFTTNPTNTNGNQQITLDIDVVLNLMNIGETVSNAGDALQTYTITSTGGRTITFNNGGAVPVPLLTKTGGATDVLNARVILAESTDFNIGGGVLRIGGNTPNAGIQVGLGSGDLKILNKLGEGSFMHSFRSKGRYSEMMSEIPVCVVMNQKVGLIGAVEESHRMMDSTSEI